MSRVLGFIGRTLIVAGLFILGFVGYQLWGTGIEEGRNQGDLTHSLAEHVESKTTDVDPATADVGDVAAALGDVDPATAPATAEPADGQPVGIIQIPKIGLERVIVQGVSKADLKKGPGHYPGTPLPGQAGNSGIAGHRTTYGAPFNRIDELVPGDEVVITTQQGKFTYKVIPAPGSSDQAWYVVKPTDVSVLTDKGDNRITMTACHPKYSAKQRIIVNAVLSTEPAATAATPASTSKPKVVHAAQLDEGLGGDTSALPVAVAFGAGALLVGLLAWWLARRGHKWLFYGLATPLVLALVWGSYVYLDRYLPSL
jgi:sortase A